MHSRLTIISTYIDLTKGRRHFAGTLEEGRSIRLSRIQIISGVVLLLAALSAVLRAQDQISPSQEERRKAINLVRAINTAEVRYNVNISHGRFASWTELYDSGLVKDLQVQVSPGREVIPGYHLDLLASSDGKSFML